MIIHRNIQVFGRVQGVGFRYSVQNEANKSGIKGYVKNMPDGSVYMELEGEEESVSRMISWCRKGPGWSRVERVVTHTNEIQGFNRFSIRY